MKKRPLTKVTKQSILVSYPLKIRLGWDRFGENQKIRYWIGVNKKTFDLEKLLELEKEMRGVPKDQVVFLGTANIANRWCDQQILFDCEGELNFFSAYLTDRLTYSNELVSMKNDFISNKKSILEIGDEITLPDIDLLLNEEYRTPVASEDKKERSKRIARLKKIKSAIERGTESQYLFSEKYPLIRWNFPWKEYVIICAPDGIRGDFVYEYKSTKNHNSFGFAKLKSDIQADLYGFFFQRKRKRVQIRIEDKKRVETFDGEVNVENALNTLQRFYDLDHKKRGIVHPRSAGSCKFCSYKEKCEIYKKLPSTTVKPVEVPGVQTTIPEYNSTRKAKTDKPKTGIKSH